MAAGAGSALPPGTAPARRVYRFAGGWSPSGSKKRPGRAPRSARPGGRLGGGGTGYWRFTVAQPLAGTLKLTVVPLAVRVVCRAEPPLL